jgi:hypothetical protein
MDAAFSDLKAAGLFDMLGKNGFNINMVEPSENAAEDADKMGVGLYFNKTCEFLDKHRQSGRILGFNISEYTVEDLVDLDDTAKQHRDKINLFIPIQTAQFGHMESVK